MLTWALCRGDCSASHCGRFNPGGKNRRYPLKGRMGQPHFRSGGLGEQNNVNITFSEPRVVIHIREKNQKDVHFCQ